MNPDTPYPYQDEGIAWLQSTRDNHYGFVCLPYRGLLADEMGLGKTAQALEVIQTLIAKGKRILFLVPGATIIQWQKQFDKWVLECEPDEFCITSLYAIKGSKSFIPDTQSCVMSHNLLAKKDMIDKLVALNFDGIVIDEIHKFGTQGTKRVQHLWALINLSPNKLADCRIGLSGTPVRNYAREIYNIAHFLDPMKFRNAEEFARKYLTYDKKALWNPQQFHNDFAPFYLRRTVSQVQKDLPEIRRTKLYTEITDPFIIQAYNHQLDLLNNFTKNAEKLQQFSLLGYLMNLKHLTGIAKANEPAIMDPILEYVMGEDSDTGPRKAVIGIHHKLVARRIQNYLGDCECGHAKMDHFELDEKTLEEIPLKSCLKCLHNCKGYSSKIPFYIIRGGMTTQQKERVKLDFIACPSPAICLLSIKAAGEGIDGLQYASSKAFVLEMQWNMAEIRQFEKRVHRTGQVNKCHIEYTIATGTVDEFFWDLSESKERLTTQVEDVNYQSNPAFLQQLAERVISARLPTPRKSDVDEFEALLKSKRSIGENLSMSDYEL